MPASLLNGIKPPTNSFVLRKHKMLYIANTKVASSSLRWMIADLAGEDFERFYRASGSHQSRFMTIHTDRKRWRHAVRVADLSPGTLAEVSRDNGWLVFTVIRDSWTRLWSAWQSKFLVQHTPYRREYAEQPWFPRVPSKPADILDDWSAFVSARPWETHDVLSADRHFMTQFSSVRPDAINYSRIYNLTEMAALEADIHAHLDRLGLDQELYLPRTNESAVPMALHALDEGIDEIIRDSYHADIVEWGDLWDLETIKLGLRHIGMEAVQAVRNQISASERIGDLSKELKRAQRRIATLETRLSTHPSTAATEPRGHPSNVNDSDGPQARGHDSILTAEGDGTPAGIAELLRAYPWPASPRYPEVEPVGRNNRGFELILETAAALRVENPVIVEIGAELGGSTRRSLLTLPGSYVVSIDPWPNGQAFGAWPELARFKGVPNASLDLFRSFNFQYGDRLVAVREYSPRGLVVVHEAGVRPHIVYIDGDHRPDAVLRDMTMAATLFPQAIICGDDWTWKPKRRPEAFGGIPLPVRAAVTQWAAFHDHFVKTRENTWLLDASRRFNLRHKTARPTAKALSPER